MASRRSFLGSPSEDSDSGLSPSDTDSESLSGSACLRRRPAGCPNKPESSYFNLKFGVK